MYTHVFCSGQDPAQHPTVILIHGLGGTLNIWDPIAGVLENRFSVLRYDLRGHGQSDVPAGDWSLEDFVHDLEAIFIDDKPAARASGRFFIGWFNRSAVCA